MPVDKELIEGLLDDKDLGDIDEYIKQIAAYLVSD